MAEFEATGETTSGARQPGSIADAAMSVLGQGGSLSADSLKTIKADSGKLLALAKDGGFAVDPEGAKKIAQAFRNMLDRIPQLHRTVRVASQAPKLGTGPYAKQIADFTKLTGSGDDQSFEAALEALEIICENAAEAYETAAKNYDEMDEAAKQTFKSGEGKL